MSNEGGYCILTVHRNVLLHTPCSQLLNIISKEVIHRDCKGIRESESISGVLYLEKIW